MGTTTSNQHTETINCQVCRKSYSFDCDWRQGRCPHHSPIKFAKWFLFLTACVIIPIWVICNPDKVWQQVKKDWRL